MQQHDAIRTAHACFSRPQIAGGAQLSAVYVVFQESIGFMWVGMQHGLARLDAHNARHFAHDPDDPGSLPGAFVISLGEDDRGMIWVGTYDGGCACYDPQSERFAPVHLNPLDGNDRVARCFQFMGDGRMWIGTNSSLTAVDPITGAVHKFRHPQVEDPFITGVNRFPALCSLDNRRLLVGTAAGAFLFDVIDESFHYLPFDERGLLEKTQHGIVGFARSGDAVFAATTHQIYRLDHNCECLELLEPLVNPPAGSINRKLTTLAVGPYDGRIWIGTMDGLLAFDTGECCYTLYEHDENDDRSLCGMAIASLGRDRSGMLWAGTANGISLLDLRHNFQYHRLRGAEESQRTLVRGFAESDGGTLWIGTINGLYEFDPATRLSHRRSLGGGDTQVERINNEILQIHRGRRFLWVGSVNGLFQYDMEERSVLRHYPTDPSAGTPGNTGSVMGLHVQGILEESDGSVWFGSDAMGLQRLDPRSDTFRYYGRQHSVASGAPHDSLLVSFEDSRGRIWFGFVTCLARYDRADDTFERFAHDPADRHSLSNNMVTAIHEDAAGGLWVGTAGGLNRMVEGEDGSVRFVRYGMGDGLPADFIVSIVEEEGTFWIGTNRGLVRFREQSGCIEARLYDEADGLHSDHYMHRAAYRDREGWLYFGGRDGFDRFRPARIRPDTLPPAVVLTEFRLFNRPAPIAPRAVRSQNSQGRSGTFVLERSITHLRDLPLSYRHSVITFRYAALHYLQPEKIRYAYKLEGFDREWIDAGTRTEATYTNLDPGAYTLRVCAANSDGTRSVRDVELAVHIAPPPWRTWWARSLYGLAGAGAITAFTRWRIERRERELHAQRRIERAREEERESIRRQNASDFHDEAGTTLTRILFLTELARRQGGEDEDLRALLEKIDDNAAQLSHGMRDFIWVLDPDRDTLLDTLQRIEAAGESLLAAGDTAFSMQYDHVKLRDVTLDLNQRRQVLMICKEAIHNAARHAKAGAVLVRANRTVHGITIAVEDDGCGFESTQENAGYGMKSMRKRAESIDAVLHIYSGSGAGTCVEVGLEIPHMRD